MEYNRNIYNQFCAEYLGFKKEGSDYLYPEKYYDLYTPSQVSEILDGRYDFRVDITSLCFHDDYKYIMEMVEAIENLNEDTSSLRSISNTRFEISNYNIKINTFDYGFYLNLNQTERYLYKHPYAKYSIVKTFDFKEKGKKQAIVEAIWQFLVWYNKNKNI